MYYFEHKQIFAGLKSLSSSVKKLVCGLKSKLFVFKMVYDNLFGGKNLKVHPLKIFVTKLVRGNAVQIFSNFPARNLSICRVNFFITPL